MQKNFSGAKMLKTTKKTQARLRLVVDNELDSGGYKSGRSLWRETPDTASIGSTRSAGTRPAASQPETVPCELSPKRRARALWPPTALQASRNASVDMPLINAQTDISVNANSGNRDLQTVRMSRRPVLKPSDFWLRLEEILKGNPAWEPINPNNIATKLDMSQGSVHRWFTGPGKPELETALQFARIGGVHVEWLLDGKKPKYIISKNPAMRELFEMCEGLDEDGIKAVLRSAEGEQLRKEKAEEAKKKAV